MLNTPLKSSMFSCMSNCFSQNNFVVILGIKKNHHGLNYDINGAPKL